MAGRRLECSSAFQRRCRLAGHRRPHQADQLHRQRGGGLGDQAQCGQEESRLSNSGGNAGVIVHSDADLAYAAERCVTGGFAYAGQTCISVQRILVERSVYAKVHRIAGRGGQETEDWRSAGGVNRCRPSDPRERCDARQPNGYRKRSAAGARSAVRRPAKGIDTGADRPDWHAPRNESELPGDFRSGSDGRTVRRL